MTLDLTSLQKGIAALSRALGTLADTSEASEVTPAIRETLQGGVIQAFEFTYELCWKFIRRWLAMNISPEAVSGISRRQLFRMAAEHGLIEDWSRWMAYHEARNLTVQTYDQDVAEKVVMVARTFLADAEALLKALQARQ